MNEQEEKALFDEYLSLWPKLLRRTITDEQALHMNALLTKAEAASAGERLGDHVRANLARAMFGTASREEIGSEIYALNHRVWSGVVRGEMPISTAFGESEVLKRLAYETNTYELVRSLQDKDLENQIESMVGKAMAS